MFRAARSQGVAIAGLSMLEREETMDQWASRGSIGAFPLTHAPGSSELERGLPHIFGDLKQAGIDSSPGRESANLILSISDAAPQSRDMSDGDEPLTVVNVSVKNCEIPVDKPLTLVTFHTLVYFHDPCHVAGYSAD